MPLLGTRPLPRSAPARVLACGAWLKNTACLIERDEVHWSPLHDDLADPAHCAMLDASVAALLARAGGPLQAVAHDLHPDFHSTHVAQRVAAEHGVPAIGVQHHHAHIAVVQAEQGLQGPVIGLALDGVGLGLDGTAWGGELLLVEGARWQRLDHLPALHLPGGDVAAREPWRMAASVLQWLGRADEITPRLAPAVGVQAARTVQAMLARKLNSPLSTGAGRWFDAVAGLLGLSVRQAFEAEAAITLENAATAWLDAHPGFDAPCDSLDLRAPMTQIAALASHGAEAQGRGAALFHLALANGLVTVAAQAARRHGTDTVVLGGGCFLNKLLTTRITQALQQQGLRVLQPVTVSCGDAGLALGQAWVAACTVGDVAFRPTHPMPLEP
ncbi:MAG: carbamoyltransferase HypF [Burkholderiales bacterium]|nr:carbamoyltransferase HypF [Burkholderiales bacterium]